MKAILYIVAIVAICGAAFLSVNHSNKFKALEAKRAETIDTNKTTTADADGKDAEIKKERARLAASNEKKELLQQSVDSLKSAGNALTNDISKLKEDLKVQDEEFAQLKKALDEVNV